jgi:hypothetical protein
MPYQFTKAGLWQDPFPYRACWCDLPSASRDNARQKVFFTDADRELSPENFIYLVNTGNYAQSFTSTQQSRAFVQGRFKAILVERESPPRAVPPRSFLIL